MIVKGVVKDGNKKGREHGFPTANISNDGVAIGIYAGKVFALDKYYKAAVYVGTPRPDVLEAHLLDFAGDLYGRVIEVTILNKLRDDFFETDNEKLRLMIEKDVAFIKESVNLDK